MKIKFMQSLIYQKFSLTDTYWQHELGGTLNFAVVG